MLTRAYYWELNEQISTTLNKSQEGRYLTNKCRKLCRKIVARLVKLTFWDVPDCQGIVNFLPVYSKILKHASPSAKIQLWDKFRDI